MEIERRAFVLITPIFVANNFIKRGLSENIEITPLKLQKLVYFLYATYLRASGQRLFTETFETWSKGPVAPSIYAEFGSYGDKPVKTLARDSQGIAYTVREEGLFKKCFDTVWGKYKDETGEYLSNLTHQAGTAWTKAHEKESPYLEDEEIALDGTELA